MEEEEDTPTGPVRLLRAQASAKGQGRAGRGGNTRHRSRPLQRYRHLTIMGRSRDPMCPSVEASGGWAAYSHWRTQKPPGAGLLCAILPSSWPQTQPAVLALRTPSNTRTTSPPHDEARSPTVCPGPAQLPLARAACPAPHGAAVDMCVIRKDVRGARR
jgi:hypothetical protein